MSTVFPPRMRAYAGVAAFFVLSCCGLVVLGVSYYATPEYTRVGYAPIQPIKFSHALHAGELGMDCLHCHSHVGKSPHANIPATQVCLNCHSADLGNIKANSPALAPLREAAATGQPVPWVKVHRVPDYAYFNHAVHVARGVSCVSCHGRVDEMDTVIHTKSLSMAWCLDCHRNPDPHLRPADKVTDLSWVFNEPDAQDKLVKMLREDVNINPPDNCAACHR